MKNKDFSLQLLTHKQIFANREDAVTYFEDNFKPYALAGEPAIAFYGEEKSPKAIIALGTSTDKRIFFIDVEELSEKIKALDDATEEEKEEIADAVDLIKNIIGACGLTFDENKKTNRVTYEPDVKDTVICDAKSLGEAIDLISKFVQKGFKDSALKVEDTETVKLVYSENEDGGKVLKANVKISDSGDSDDVDFNDNIICKKSDGIYATSNLEYDADKHQLVFTSSGYKDGKYKDDAHRKTISLEEHSSIDVENHNHNIALTINKVSGTNKYIISGDVVLSENTHNILEVENNALLVKGISSKIQYGSTTVEKELDSINGKIDDVNDKIDNIADNLNIEGTSTDTLNVSIRKLSHGFSVSGDVRLSNDGSIKVSDGGISTNIDVTVDSLTNTLTLSNGSRTKTVTLPGIEIVKNIYYDEANAVLVIELNNSSNPLKIPVADMIETIDVQNDASSAVELHKHSKEGVTGKSYLSGTLKIRTNDNLLAKDSSTGELYVPKSSMTDAIAEETNRAKEAEKALQTNIDANTKAINDEVTRAKAAETELHNSDDAINAELLSVKNKLEAETTARETFDNTIKATVDNHTQSLADINSSLNEVKSDLAEETSARELADTNLTNSISTNATAIEKEINRAKEAETTISEIVEKNAEAFAAFKEATNTSIQSLKDSDTELKELITDKVTDINAEIADVKNNVTTVTNGLATEVERAKEAEATLTSGVADNKKAIADEVKRSSDKDVEIENTLSTHIGKFDDFKASTVESIEKLTEASESVTAKVNEIDNAYKTADTALQTNLDKEVTRATTAEEKFSANLTTEVERAKAEETSLSNKIADNIAAINTEVTRATAAEAELAEKVNTKVAAVEIRKNSASDLQYTLYVDEKPCGDINIPEDQFLKSVTYDEVSKTIHFVFKTTDGEQTTDINVSDLVDTYTAGYGLKLEGNKFSVQISEGSESYLTVTEGGVKLTGISAELAKKANVGDSYTKAESDSKYITEHQDVSNLATKDEVKALSDELSETETKVTENSAAITVINSNEATDGSIKKSLADAKVYADTVVKAQVKEVSDKLAVTDTNVADNAKAIEVLNGNEATEGSVKKALVDANTYTDSKVSDSESKTLETAKTYADNSVKTETDRAKIAEKANADAIVALQAEDVTIKSDLAKKIEKVTIEKNSASDLQYILYVDDKKVSEINIAKDQFLKDVSYDSTSKKLHFVFETTDGVKEQDIEIGDLVDTYTAGDGLKVEDNKFSVIINNDSEKYLTLSNEGLKISGIDSALATKAEVGASYTKAESDAKYLTEHQDISALATKDEVKAVSDCLATTDAKVADNAKAIETLNGNEATVGSVKKALADAKAYTDAKVTENTYVAGDGLSLNDKKFAVKKADGSQKYLEVIADGVKIVGVDEALATKANSADVYTIAQIDAKGYLTEHQDISGLATKTEVSTVDEKLALAKTDLETKVGNVENDVEAEETRATEAEKALETKIADNFTKSSFTVNKTNTVNLVKTANADGSSVLSANVEVSAISGNLIKADQPLYAAVDLSYDEGTNTLKFSSSALAETKEIKLSVGSIIDSITYDAATEEIVISYTNAGGEKGEVRFSARTLFNQLTVQTDHLGAIILSKETKDGKDILSGEVVLSSLATNALINDQGSLYVSNQAKDYKMADDTTVENAITTVKTTVNTLSEKVTEFGAKVTAIEANDKVQDANIKANSNSIVSIKEKSIEQDGKITTLEANDKVQDTNIKANSDAITIVNEKVAEQSEKISTIEDKVKEIDKKTTVTVANSSTITMNKTDEGVITSKVAIDSSANNLLKIGDDGLLVDGSVSDYGTY